MQLGLPIDGELVTGVTIDGLGFHVQTTTWFIISP